MQCDDFQQQAIDLSKPDLTWNATKLIKNHSQSESCGRALSEID